MKRLLTRDVRQRVTAAEALLHPFITGNDDDDDDDDDDHDSCGDIDSDDRIYDYIMTITLLITDPNICMFCMLLFFPSL